MSSKLKNAGGGSGQVIQVMPLVPGQQGASSGEIDVSDMTIITIFGDCDAYVDDETTLTFPITTEAVFEVSQCSTITVDAAVKYTWV